MNSEFVVWFDDYDPAHKPRIGGKNASLGEMIEVGLPVPPGLAVTTKAYETLRSNVMLLQSRPETVWSRKGRRTVARPDSGFMDGIVSTLLSPVHARDKTATSVEDDDSDSE